jgi:DNA polymerase (family X)
MKRVIRRADMARAMAVVRSRSQATMTPLSPEEAVGELSRVAGLGATRALRLHEDLGVSTLVELREALADGRVAQLRGFGDATAHRLGAAVSALLDPHALLPLAEAELHVQRLLAYMKLAPAADSVEAGGAFRRRSDVIDGIMLLVVSTRPDLVMRYFRAYADAVTSSTQDPSRGSLRLQCGLPVELRIVPGRCRGAALHHLTGDANYEAAVRAVGLQQGVRISEYGIFRIDAGRAGARRVGGQREEDVFEALDMQWIPPELRQNEGEIEAALQGALPRLLCLEEIRGDLRVRAGHAGTSGVDEMLRACRNARYSYCAIITPLGSVAPNGGEPPSLHDVRAQIDDARGRFPTLHVLHGVEVGIRADGVLELDDDIPADDLVIAHASGRGRLTRARATDRLLRALQDPRVDVLACLTGRIVGERPPADLDYDEIFRAAAAAGIAIELSAEARRLDPPHGLLRAAAGAGIPILISSSADSAAGLGMMRFGVDQARRAWLQPAQVLNAQPWDHIAEWRRRRKG